MVATIKEVAKKAEVSVTAVSLVLNNIANSRIKKETREKVLQVASELNYSPSRFAKSLIKKKSEILGIVAPHDGHVFSDFFFAEAMGGIGDVIDSKGYKMLVQFATPEFIKNKVYLSLFTEKIIDGLLIIGAVMDDEKYFIELKKAGYPFVLVNNSNHTLKVPHVIEDSFQGISSAVEHLVKLGHKKIIYITIPRKTYIHYNRLEAYKKAIKDFGLDNGEEMVMRLDNVDMTIEEDEVNHLIEIHGVLFARFPESIIPGYIAGKMLLKKKNRPSGIIAMNDWLAVGIIAALQEAGVFVPDEIAVIGFDDLVWAAHVSPPLTTMRVPIYDIGAESAKLLIDYIEKGREAELIEKMMSVELVIRKSCGDIRHELTG